MNPCSQGQFNSPRWEVSAQCVVLHWWRVTCVTSYKDEDTYKCLEEDISCIVEAPSMLAVVSQQTQASWFLIWLLAIPTPVFLGFPCGSAGKESAFNAGDLGLTLGLGRSFGEGKGYPLQYSGLETFMDCTVHGVTKSQTWLSDFHFHFMYSTVYN